MVFILNINLSIIILIHFITQFIISINLPIKDPHQIQSFHFLFEIKVKDFQSSIFQILIGLHGLSRFVKEFYLLELLILLLLFLIF